MQKLFGLEPPSFRLTAERANRLPGATCSVVTCRSATRRDLSYARPTAFMQSQPQKLFFLQSKFMQKRF